jgi:hypothetical protein
MIESFFNFTKSLVYALFIYLGMKTGTVKILAVLMACDSFLGIIKALRLGHKFSFKRLGWGMVSKLSLLFIPMVIALMGKGLNFNFNLFIIATINILIVNEGISCITNILSIKTKKHVENADYITKMLLILRRGFMGVMQKLLHSIDDKKIKK